MKKHNYILLFLVFSFFAVPLACKKPNAGVLPYTYIKGQAYFLLGQEPDGTWADFGGRPEQDETTFQTAVREFAEETRYVFVIGDEKPVRTWKLWFKKGWTEEQMHTFLQKSFSYVRQRVEQKLIHPRGYYVSYLIQSTFVPTGKFLKAPDVPHDEKIDYCWVPAIELLDVAQQSTDRRNTFVRNMKLRRQFVDLIKYHATTIRHVLER